jgi:S-formylglutathione hydrolase FrmB
MKRILLSFVFIQTIYFGNGQNLKGRIVTDSINSPSLKNSGGENPIWRVSVYLPPDYDQTTTRYAVIYFLHGFWGDETVISALGAEVDKAISSGKIKPVILVVPNEETMYEEAFT